MKALEQLRAALNLRKSWAKLGKTTTEDPLPALVSLGLDAVVELADELQADRRGFAGAVNELDDKLRALSRQNAPIGRGPSEYVKVDGVAVRRTHELTESLDAALGSEHPRGTPPLFSRPRAEVIAELEAQAEHPALYPNAQCLACAARRYVKKRAEGGRIVSVPDQQDTDEGASPATFHDALLRRRAKAFADDITAKVVSHAQAIKNAYAIAKQYGWKSDDLSLAEWIDRRCCGPVTDTVIDAAKASGFDPDKGPLAEFVMLLGADAEEAHARVRRYGGLLQKVQAIVSPESGPAPFDQLPDLVARAVADRERLGKEYNEVVAEMDRADPASAWPGANLAARVRDLAASNKVLREGVRELESELQHQRVTSQLRPVEAPAPYTVERYELAQARRDIQKLRDVAIRHGFNPDDHKSAVEFFDQRLAAVAHPLKLYVVEYSFFRAFVMAENADKAREYVRGETDGSAAAFKTTPIDMTKPGVLRR